MKKWILGATAAVVAFALAGCAGDENKLIGEWQTAVPKSVKEKVADATYATQSLTIKFGQGEDVTTGPVELTSEYDMTAPADSAGNAANYKVTAKISGTWTRDVDDQDDYLLAFDKNSLKVEGKDAPELGPVTDLFLNSLARFSTIDDVEVSKDGKSMSFEIENPDATIQFVKK